MNHVLFTVQNLSVPQDTRVWREAVALRQAGYEVTVICPRTSGGPWREVLEGVEIRRFPQLPELPGILGQVVETIGAFACTTAIALGIRARRKVDVLHTANPPDSFWPLARLLRPFGTRFVFDQHDLVPELLEARGGSTGSLQGRAFAFLERQSYRAADLVITPNDSYRATAVRRGRIAARDVVTVRSGPDQVWVDASRRPQDTDETMAPRLAFAGVMGPQDGVDALVRAVAQLQDLHPEPFTVEMIGRGSEVPALRSLADELGVAARFTWTGWLSQEQLRERLRTATIGISPDHDNAFTRKSTMTKIAEYLSLGLPAVIAELPENRCTAGEAAVYYEAGNPSDLAKRLDELLRDADLRDELHRRAVERAQHLLWEHSAQRLVSAYQMLLDGAPGPHGNQVIGATAPSPSTRATDGAGTRAGAAGAGGASEGGS